jgi:pyruvate formate-lyase activating enzyme-like uncharacterized protein
MTPILKEFFTDYAERAMRIQRECYLAKNYYQGISRRLKLGQDLGDELPQINVVGIQGTKEVVAEALKEFSEKERNAWDLPIALRSQCKSQVTIAQESSEIYPRQSVSHAFTTEAGVVNVFISTMGQNYKIEINAGQNKMAAEAAMFELEKMISFALMLGT